MTGTDFTKIEIEKIGMKREYISILQMQRQSMEVKNDFDGRWRIIGKDIGTVIFSIISKIASIEEVIAIGIYQQDRQNGCATRAYQVAFMHGLGYVILVQEDEYSGHNTVSYAPIV